MFPKGRSTAFSSRRDSDSSAEAPRMTYLAVIERTPSNYAGFVPDVKGATGIGDSREVTLQALSRGLALALQELTERGLPPPTASPRTELDLSDYEPTEPYEIVEVSPARMNPVSIEIEQALESAGVTRTELARRMQVIRSVVSRITDSFYFGHSLRTVQRVADALNVRLEIKLAQAG